MQARIGAAVFHQAFVRSRLRDAAIFDDHQAVGLPQGAEAMRDGDSRTAFHQMVECGLNFTLRLGIDAVNPIYGQFIRGALRSSCSLGIVGGLPEKSLYFVGYQDWDLFFLDPHILKPFDQSAFSDPDKLIKDYHTARVRSIPIEEIDPSMLFGFLCCSAEEVVQLRDHLIKLNRHANILSIKND